MHRQVLYLINKAILAIFICQCQPPKNEHNCLKDMGLCLNPRVHQLKIKDQIFSIVKGDNVEQNMKTSVASRSYITDQLNRE